MDRVPEPELMAAPEQVAAYAAADFAEPHDRFVALLRARLPDLPLEGRAADLGCGPCDVAVRFARAYPRWTVDAADASQAMLAAAVPLLERAGMSERISRLHLRLPCDSPGERRYNLVFSNSLLHHLAAPAVLWDALRRWTRPDAAVFIMDLLRPRSRKEAGGLVERYASGEPSVLRDDFYNSLLAAYRPEEVRGQLAAAGLGDLTLEVVSDRHGIVWGRISASE
jgi:SAM-dependent methyltransferase